MSFSPVHPYVTLSSPAHQSLDLTLASPPLGRNRCQLPTNASSSNASQDVTRRHREEEPLVTYEEAMRQQPQQMSEEASMSALDVIEYTCLLNEKHLTQIKHQRRHEEIKASWLLDAGLDVTDPRNGPMPHCTVDELMLGMNNFFGAPTAAKKSRSRGSSHQQQQSPAKRKKDAAEDFENGKQQKSRKAVFVEKCRAMQWMV